MEQAPSNTGSKQTSFNKLIPGKLLLLLIFLIIFMVVSTIAGVIFFVPPKENNTNVATGELDLNNNTLVYARCNDYSYTYSPISQCNVFAQTLINPDTLTKIQTFTYNTANNPPFYEALDLKGFVDKYVLYIEDYYDKTSYGAWVQKNRIGFIDLKTNNRTVIAELTSYTKLKSANDPGKVEYLVNVLPDNINKKIFYEIKVVSGPGVTQESDWQKKGVSINYFIKEYDFATKQTEIIADDKLLKLDLVDVPSASGEEIVLYNDSVYDINSNSALKGELLLNKFSYKTCKYDIGRLNLKNNSFTQDSKLSNENIIYITFSKSGDRLAYVSRSDGRLDIKVANIDRTNTKIIGSFPMVDKEDCGYAEKLEFSPSGDMLFFSTGDKYYIWKDDQIYSLDTFEATEVVGWVDSRQKNWETSWGTSSEFLVRSGTQGSYFLSPVFYDDTKTARLNLIYPVAPYSIDAFLIP